MVSPDKETSEDVAEVAFMPGLNRALLLRCSILCFFICLWSGGDKLDAAARGEGMASSALTSAPLLPPLGSQASSSPCVPSLLSPAAASLLSSSTELCACARVAPITFADM
jgi:hypothetical protein